MTVELELTTGVEAAAEARRALDGLSGQLPERRLRDVRLLVSELVTNAVRHAQLTAGDRIRLRVRLEAEAVRVEVHDPGRGFELRSPQPDPARASGWGLFLVDELADRWGMEPTDPGTSIWFEVDRGDGAGPSARR